MKYLTELVEIVYYIQKPMRKNSTLSGSVQRAAGGGIAVCEDGRMDFGGVFVVERARFAPSRVAPQEYMLLSLQKRTCGDRGFKILGG